MALSLNNLKEASPKKLLIVFIVTIIAITIIAILTSPLTQKPRKDLPSTAPIPVSQQPVVNKQFDSSAPVSQKSKSQIDILKNKLPYRQTITASTGNKVTFVLFTNPRDPYALYIETASLNFQSTYQDPNLAKNVLDFRETAATIFDWLKSQNVSESDIFISWGDKAYIQKNAEAWLVESPQYPKVIKKGDSFVFEKEPAK